MKKFIALLVTAILLVSFAVSASADEPVLAGATNWTEYALYDSNGTVTEGVTIYAGTTAVTADMLTPCLHQQWPANVISTGETQRLIAWTDQSWLANFGLPDINAELQFCDNESYVEFKFNGTGFGIGTSDPNYTDSQVKVVIDGVDQSVDFALAAGEKPLYFYETDALAEGNHTVKVSAVGGTVVLTMFKIMGTLGHDEAPATGSYTVAAALVAVVAVASVAVVGKKHN